MSDKTQINSYTDHSLVALQTVCVLIEDVTESNRIFKWEARDD